MSNAPRNAAGLRAARASGYRSRETGAKAINAGSRNASAPKYSAPLSAVAIAVESVVDRTGLYVLGGLTDSS